MLREKLTILLKGILALTFVGIGTYYADRLLNDNLPYTPFYLSPIIYVTWYTSRRWGFYSAIYGVVALTIATILAGTVRSWQVMLVPIILQLVTYSMVVWLVGTLRDSLTKEKLLSRTDPLTSLPNFRAFGEAARHEIERMKRANAEPLSIVYFDVDDFKRINDKYGHSVGDDVLGLVSKAIAFEIRSIDTPARLGGDEFVVLLPNTDQAGAKIVVERLQERFAKIQSNGGISCSIGVVTFLKPPLDVDSMIHEADLIMYEAKTHGKKKAQYRVVENPFLVKGNKGIVVGNEHTSYRRRRRGENPTES